MGSSPGNTAQREAWDGPTGDLWTTWADRFDAGVADHHAVFLEAAEILMAERVLDVGCGAGQTSLDAARAAVNGPVLGVDLSSSLLDVAGRRAQDAGLRNVTFACVDAQEHAFDEATHDVVVSRHGTMFFADPVAAFANLRAALRPGGRMALLTWQPFAEQEWMRRFFALAGATATPPDDAPSPLGLSDPARVHRVLGAAGFADVTLTGHRAPMYYGRDPDDALPYVADLVRGLAGDPDPAERERILAALYDDLVAHHGPDGVTYDAATWIVRARRA